MNDDATAVLNEMDLLAYRALGLLQGLYEHDTIPSGSRALVAPVIERSIELQLALRNAKGN